MCVYIGAQALPSTSSTNINMKHGILAHTALSLFGLPPLCQGHSWVEQVSLVSYEGMLPRALGYPRGNGTSS